MAARNLALRLRVQGAAARFASVNDQALRRIGADLHDGPAQLMGFAALRLDALQGQVAGQIRARGEDLAAVQRAVKDSILEIRSIARGLVAARYRAEIAGRYSARCGRGACRAHRHGGGLAVATRAWPARGGENLLLSLRAGRAEQRLAPRRRAGPRGAADACRAICWKCWCWTVARGLPGFRSMCLRDDAGLGSGGVGGPGGKSGRAYQFCQSQRRAGRALRMELDLKEAI